MKEKSICIRCGGTGVLVNGEPCLCGIQEDIILPSYTNIPPQYQAVRFNEELLPDSLDISYKLYMSKLMKEVTRNLHVFNKNILICSPPNSGKTIFAYTVYGIQYAKGEQVPDLMDIMEVREILMNPYNLDKIAYTALNEAKVVFIKIPQDLPSKLGEMMSTIIERRVRRGNSTIFLYSGSKDDLIAQDKFGKISALFGDGSYNSIEVNSWKSKNIKEEKKQ